MKFPHIPERPPTVPVGLAFISIAVVWAVVFLADANKTAFPLLYICFFGGLMAIPFVLGVDTIIRALRLRKRRHH